MVVVLLYFLINFIGADQIARAGRDVWQQTTTNSVNIWTLLMMPLFLTLETSLLAGLEHVDKNWKSLLALPAPRWTLYLSKLVVTIGLLWAACAILVGGTWLSGAVLKATRPVLNIHALPVSLIAAPMLRVAVAALCATTIQHWVSLRWHSFPVAMGFGMCAMVTGFIAVNSATWGPRYPWSLPLYTIRRSAAAAAGAVASAPPAAMVMAIAVAGAAVVALAGCLEFSRREIA
jgi:ABC-2 type transport system permease protein